MATRYLVQQQWPNKWGTVAVFRTQRSAQAWIADAKAHGSTAEFRIEPPDGTITGSSLVATASAGTSQALGGCQS